MGNIGAYLAYFSVSLALLVGGVAAYAAITPYRELTLIRAGNSAAAWSLGGTALGLAAAIASAAAHSMSFLDMLLWAAIALVGQLAAFLAVSKLVPGLRGGIEDDKAGYGILLGALSLAVGLINAGSLTW
ncbi:MAG TPA: DUF350 domain-containing protein [Candidatus Omnitrophota bacterium]|nr:DUF350 domain-containing protein [Candidatus Omnitrophota bacterium]